eukprot:2708292-Lingulodinium_polyedra.AAC.1
MTTSPGCLQRVREYVAVACGRQAWPAGQRAGRTTIRAKTKRRRAPGHECCCVAVHAARALQNPAGCWLVEGFLEA